LFGGKESFNGSLDVSSQKVEDLSGGQVAQGVFSGISGLPGVSLGSDLINHILIDGVEGSESYGGGGTDNSELEHGY
jgi:hypothetical protein